MTTPYIGSKISLISRLDIRYEGTLHSVDPIDSTISLSQVRSFGTEDRPAPVTVPSRDEVYEFIIFKASDIKDLIVCETPKPPEAPPSVNDINYDPAIVSVSKPQQPQPELPAIDGRRSSAQEYSQASSPPAQLEQQAQPPKLGQLMGGFGQNVQRSYYRSAPMPQQQQPPHQNQQHQHYHSGQQQQQYNRPPPRTYYGGQNRMAAAPNEQQHGRGGGGYQPGGGYQGQNRRGYQQYPSRQQYPQQGQNQWPRPAQRNNNGHQHHQQQQQPHHAAPLIDGDFDFEQANKQFRESVTDVADKMAKAKLADVQEDKSNRSSARNSEERSTAKPTTTEKQPIEAGTKAGGGGGRNENFYDKSISFFDNISCEALEKEEGKNTRVDWKKERMTNQETFGTSAVRMHNFRRGGGRGGGGYRGGYYQNRGGGGYQQRTRPLLPPQQEQ